jgi:methyltransferase
MTSLVLFTIFVALVGVERIVELVVSVRNAARSLGRGGIEYGRAHYPWMVLLHTGLLVGAVAEVWLRRPAFVPELGWPMALVVLAAQGLRWWCIATLGTQWNTRVIVVPGLSLVRRGPYRWISHPNYVAVVAEGVALPLVHSAWITCVAFTALNGWLLTVRIRVENDALSSSAAPTPETAR